MKKKNNLKINKTKNNKQNMKFKTTSNRKFKIKNNIKLINKINKIICQLNNSNK